MSERNERDKTVLAALDESIRRAPEIGICADSFAALKAEFLRVMGERDAAIIQCENQQNHICALMQASEALRPVWVPVVERLPETTVCVLVAYSDGTMEVDAWGHDGWMGEDLSNGEITHWMPLPEPPGVKRNE